MNSQEILEKIIFNNTCHGQGIDCIDCPLKTICNLFEDYNKNPPIVQLAKIINEFLNKTESYRGNSIDNLKSYFETAFWTNEFCKDFTLSDIAKSAWYKAQKDISAFIQIAGDLLDGYGSNMSQIMHDFWLTRNRHGAGFWDGDYDEQIGKKLTEICHKHFPEINLYVGDNGKLYFDLE